MIAHIISVGTELLLGEIVNTNATFIAKELKSIGISVYHINTLGDNKNRLYDELNYAIKESDIIITTGGLGPTKDDLTKETIAEFLNLEMQLVEEEVNKLKNWFKNRLEDLNEGNMSQAYFPKNSTIIDNLNGTASGCIINKDGKVIIILPGPPREMKPMMINTVLPYLQNLSSIFFAQKTINILGIGESKMEEKIMPLIKNQSNPTIAPYFKDTNLTVRVMSSAESKEKAEKLLPPTIEKIKSILLDDVYAIGDDIFVEDVVCKYLIDNDISISVSESCTGGMLSSRLINVPNISKCYKQGFVTYSNESKISVLGVKQDTLEKYGAVSEQTAIEMAVGTAKVSNSDVAISTTGLAGPGGGTQEKPVGLVYVGLYIKGKTFVKKLNIKGNREKIRLVATNYAIDFLRRNLKVPIYEF